MKKRLIWCLLITLLAGITPYSAFASNVHLNGLPAAHRGELVIVSGTTSFSEVNVKVIRPNGTVLYFNTVTANPSTNGFSTTFSLPADASLGDYTVLAGQGSAAEDITSQILSVTLPLVTPSPTPKPTESPSPAETSSPTPTPVPGVASAPTPSPFIVSINSADTNVKKETAADGRVTTTVTLDAGNLGNAFDQLKGKGDKGAAQIISIALNNVEGSAKIELPASAFIDAAINVPNAVVSIQSDKAGYSLPIKVLDMASFAQSLGVETSNININVKMEEVATTVSDQINLKAKDSGITPIGTAIEFTVTAEADGKTVDVTHFGSTYVERTIFLQIAIDSNNATGVFYNPQTNEFSFVPALFKIMDDGKTEIIMKRNGNSIYTVVSSSKSFDDIKNHWARADIELLASKLIVSGITSAKFGPDNKITRAQFATLLARALGLSPDIAAASFKDVRENDWFAGAVGAAVKAKLVSGYADHMFKPNDNITREQVAAMVANAIMAANVVIQVDSQDQLLAKFNDKASISPWAKIWVAQSVQAKIISGKTEKTFAPTAYASRAEAVVMLKRMLQYVKFIN